MLHVALHFAFLVKSVQSAAAPVLRLTRSDRDCCCGDGRRSTAQAIALKEHLPVDMVMNLDVPREIIMDRLTDRWIHPGSGRVYAYAYRPPQVWDCFSPFWQALTCEPCT